MLAVEPCEHHLKIYPGVRDHAAKVTQFIKKSSLVSFIHNHNAKNIVDPDHLDYPVSLYESTMFKKPNITIFNMVSGLKITCLTQGSKKRRYFVDNLYPVHKIGCSKHKIPHI